jgi:dTDP-4-dehydrorhamnose reductase
MRILVTGGAGYLGAELCEQALGRGLDVVATQQKTKAPYGNAITLDVRDVDAVHRAFLRTGPDVVVHTAYVLSGTDLHDVVVRGSCNVAEAAARVGARLLHLSTDLVFDGTGGAPYRETDEPRPVLDYGAAKAEAERLAAERAPEALLVRTSLLYGKPGGAQERLAARDDVTFYEDEIRCPTRVDELAAALLELAELDVSGPLHVAGPDAVSRLEFARFLRGGGDASGLRSAPTPSGRPRDVALDSTKAAGILKTRLSGLSGMGRSA